VRAAADVDDLAGDEVGVLGDEELDGSGHVVRCSDAPAWDPCRLDARCSSRVRPARAALTSVMAVWMTPGPTALTVMP